jgi:hypothetical protein
MNRVTSISIFPMPQAPAIRLSWQGVRKTIRQNKAYTITVRITEIFQGTMEIN